MLAVVSLKERNNIICRAINAQCGCSMISEHQHYLQITIRSTHLHGRVAVAQVGRDSHSVGNVVQRQLCDVGLHLQEQRQGLPIPPAAPSRATLRAPALASTITADLLPDDARLMVSAGTTAAPKRALGVVLRIPSKLPSLNAWLHRVLAAACLLCTAQGVIVIAAELMVNS